MSHLQLAAIMFSDIVGFTALMGNDTNEALEVVNRNQKLHKSLSKKHNGHLIKEIGDGLLVQFNTAMDAINCALEIQNSANKEFHQKLRIGIHLGDIVFEKGDVYGDGVNIASRLESVCDAGGIYISESVDKAIRGQLKIQTRYLGELPLKNVSYKVGTYALQGPRLPVPYIGGDKNLDGIFLANINRRGIFRAGFTYLVVAILIILFHARIKWVVAIPDFMNSIFIISIFILFPVFMFLAWNFEKSPEGFIRINSKKSWRNPYKANQRKPLTSSTAIAGFIGIIILLYFFPIKDIRESSNPVKSLTDVPHEHSIAVLPFIDLSQTSDQGPLCIGMTTEILNHLYKIDQLLVTSSTSVIRYKNTDKPISQIAEELGVSNIVGGSIRKADDHLKIDVHLMEGSTERRLWSETYERQLKDVFEIQSEVAKQIARALSIKIYPEVQNRIESVPTSNPKAYSLYLEARKDEDNDIKNQALLEEAIRLDPNFSEAYITLANYRLSDIIFTRHLLPNDLDEYLEEIEDLLSQGLSLDPENAEGHVWMGSLNLWFYWDFDKADEYYRRAYELNPAMPLSTFAEFLLATGRFDEALDKATLSVKANPYSGASWVTQAICYYFLNEQNKATEAINIAQIKTDANLFLGGGIFRLLVYQGKYDELLRKYHREYRDQQNPRLMSMVAISYYHTGQIEKANIIVEELKQQSATSPIGSPSFYLAMIYAQMGESNKAFKALNNAIKDREVELYWLKVEPPFKPIHSDSRWQKVLSKLGFL